MERENISEGEGKVVGKPGSAREPSRVYLRTGHKTRRLRCRSMRIMKRENSRAINRSLFIHVTLKRKGGLNKMGIRRNAKTYRNIEAEKGVVEKE